ncbi:MAG: DUF190 domain-containing protein [Deltaproteobacteria bacterium]|nr:DUF190 domain-containing protein [Deltaproteobacteria bacterium]
MRILTGEQILMRVFLGESDRYKGRPLYQELVELFRREGIAGATVFRGIMGYGARSRIHTDHLLRLSQDLPVVIEVVDMRENIDRVLPHLDELPFDGLVTMEKVQVHKYGVAPRGEKSE